MQWTKKGTQPALTARVEPSSDVGNVGATFETVVRFIPPNIGCKMHPDTNSSAESALQTYIDRVTVAATRSATAAIAILQMKGMMSFNSFVEQFQMPVQFLISNVCLFLL